MANINDRINGQEFESASPLAHAVRYDRAQVKTEEQKKQARENIGCYCEAGGGSSGGGSSGGGVLIVHQNYDDEAEIISLDKTAAEILEAFETMSVIIAEHYESGNATFWNQHTLSQVMIEEGIYVFTTIQDDTFYAANDNDYPTDQEPSGG